jgi:hypothetical protein
MLWQNMKGTLMKGNATASQRRINMFTTLKQEKVSLHTCLYLSSIAAESVKQSERKLHMITLTAFVTFETLSRLGHTSTCVFLHKWDSHHAHSVFQLVASHT